MQILILYPRLTESETLGMGSNNLNDKHTRYWCVCACVHAQVLQSRLFATPWTIAHEDPLSMRILQARILKWVAMPSSRGSSQLRDGTRFCCTSCIVGGFFTHWATWEIPILAENGKPIAPNLSLLKCLVFPGEFHGVWRGCHLPALEIPEERERASLGFSHILTEYKRTSSYDWIGYQGL